VNGLLDVNALVALAHQGHADHSRMIHWFASLSGSDARLATCAITEIGFVRVSIQAGFERDAAGAVETLEGLKQSSRIPFVLLPDALGANRRPDWASGPKQVTGGHLLELARENDMQLVTLDKGIPQAALIP
jgi:predicted nucleic acid-binding protein